MFNFTRQEKQVVLFLLTVSLAGMGVDYWFKVNPKAKSIVCESPDLTRVNLNTADKQELISISGIGEKLAQRILDFRKAKGSFREIEELENVPGFKGFRFKKIRDFLSVGQPK
ncbi:MAG: helix-hairpin-helix domain-containing protein [Candidatus Omnitrophota bacterium]|nr:helix-hairpin-helix domain-containing protein [Candidatus Omnitrophota bacterium]MBU1928443.1 helix-hairpin-helix domain-containing protein [Candidatus Omnitrophota bacterium]MBU2034408.1 helix-hairpin-helix domain-containing protein [Candidatus Omnitrophota bacterium]MBU2222188.1 helix-hairpin-helix domain-containing protein [Candidatus Omnitrophota bacterium]MBU2258231.1 helix-hairpin-helix domain-containing protein [Candidatus Omnitrophota bacterium]